MLFFSDRQKTFLSETQKNKTKKPKNQKGKKKKQKFKQILQTYLLKCTLRGNLSVKRKQHVFLC